MGLTGKWARQVKINSDGDAFHDDLIRAKPHHVSNICPDKVQNVDLHQGDWGHVGSIIIWSFVHDGKKKTAKDVIETMDEEKKSVTFKVIEGDLLEEYKSFIAKFHVNTKGENNLVTWKFEYEKLEEEVPDPETLMDLVINGTKDTVTHHSSSRCSVQPGSHAWLGLLTVTW